LRASSRNDSTTNNRYIPFSAVNNTCKYIEKLAQKHLVIFPEGESEREMEEREKEKETK